MQKEYIITVIGTQEIDGEKDKIEVITTGDYVLKNGHRYIKYKEYDNENPSITTDTVVKVENDNKVTILRMGEHQSRLVLENGVRHQCHYHTAMGDILMGVYTSKVEHTLTDKGGDIKVKYQLDFFADLVSDNEIHINIKEKEE
ncbi:MAG: DUF1934 domain-containing protein [Ruminococcaceae bacterium]|nr:DUF1934 domain-containing protein [Oscillospiraceae bacterium]